MCMHMQFRQAKMSSENLLLENTLQGQKDMDLWTYQKVKGQSGYPFANQKTECFGGSVAQSL